MPLARRMPKRGFSNAAFRKEYHVVNLKALEAGMANLQRHVENVQKFGLAPGLRLSTEVVRAEPTDGEDGWLVTARPARRCR
jgi:ribosomal protein L15